MVKQQNLRKHHNTYLNKTEYNTIYFLELSSKRFILNASLLLRLPKLPNQCCSGYLE